jgi:antitoxin MazE
MKTAIQQWGNSLAVRIPKAFAEEARVKKGTPVNLRVEKGRLIVVPLPGREPTLKELLAKVNSKNLHLETDWGPAAGKEIW